MPSNLAYENLREMEKYYARLGVNTMKAFYFDSHGAIFNYEELKKALKYWNEKVRYRSYFNPQRGAIR